MSAQYYESSEMTVHPAHQPLHVSVQAAMERYFVQLEDASTSNLYDMILAEVEMPVLKIVLRQTSFNQSKAADILGISRGTLRRKMKQYDLQSWIKAQRISN